MAQHSASGEYFDLLRTSPHSPALEGMHRSAGQPHHGMDCDGRRFDMFGMEVSAAPGGAWTNKHGMNPMPAGLQQAGNPRAAAGGWVQRKRGTNPRTTTRKKGQQQGNEGGGPRGGAQETAHSDGAKVWKNVTTVMMRNLPNRYTQSMLLEELKWNGFNLERDFDFIYLPMDHANSVNLGYCFINFVENRIANCFAAHFQGKGMKYFNSKKTIEVTPASIQGYERNYNYYASTKVVHADDPAYRPIFIPRQPQHQEAMTYGGDPSLCSWWSTSQQAETSYVDGLVGIPHAGVMAPAGLYPVAAQLTEHPLPKTTAEVVVPVLEHEGYDTDEELGWDARESPHRSPTNINLVQPEPGSPQEQRVSPDSMRALFQDGAAGSSPLYVRNTFLHAAPERSESVDGFLPNRLAKSCPVSANASELGSANIDMLHGRPQQPVNSLPFHSEQSGIASHSDAAGNSYGGGTDASSRRPPPWVGADLDGAGAGMMSLGMMGPVPPQSVGGEGSSNQNSMWASFSHMSAVMPMPPQQFQGYAGTYQETAVSYPMVAAPSFGSTGPPNTGSALHGLGKCKPCAFAFRPKGCPAGAECTFCHLCDGRGRISGKNQRDTTHLEMPSEESMISPLRS